MQPEALEALEQRAQALSSRVKRHDSPPAPAARTEENVDGEQTPWARIYCRTPDVKADLGGALNSDGGPDRESGYSSDRIAFRKSFR